MTFDEAERLLKAVYCEDELSAQRVRDDAAHWERVAGDPQRFPNADMEWITNFTDAAYIYLAERGLRPKHLTGS